MKILTLRLPDDLYDKIWQIHSDTRNSVNSIIIELVEKGLEKNKDDFTLDKESFKNLKDIQNPEYQRD